LDHAARQQQHRQQVPLQRDRQRDPVLRILTGARARADMLIACA
jgi:hypothetical protein